MVAGCPICSVIPRRPLLYRADRVHQRQVPLGRRCCSDRNSYPDRRVLARSSIRQHRPDLNTGGMPYFVVE